MISVSNSFKKAIKSDDRRIYGYVDVKYQNKDYETSVTQIPTNLEIVSDNGILSGKKTMQKYATLENNYTLLDGSFIVWNENIIVNNGYISDNTFENIVDSTILITNNSDTISTKGVTIYFKENLPFDFTVTFTDTDNNTIVDDVENNQSYIYQYLFNDEKYISTIEINISRVEFSQNRLRIAYIDFNLSDFYEGDELISFDVEEALDLLVESLPINNCTINLNNYPDINNGNKFDPINPKGITKYLNNEVMLEPYIGVLTETNGIEYVPMGVFYLSDWSSNSDGNVTMNGQSVLSKLENINIKPNSNFFSSMTSSELENNIKNTLDINTSFISYSNIWNNTFLENTNLLNYLKHVVPYLLYYDNFTEPYKQYRKFYVNRYNTLVLNALNFNSRDNISRTNIINDVDYKTRQRVKELNVSVDNYGVYSNYRSTTIVPNYSHTLSETEEYLWFSSNQILVTNTVAINYTVSSGNAVASLVGHNNRLICVKVTGSIGSSLNITCTSDICDFTNSSSTYTYYNSVDNGDSVDIDMTKNVYISPDYLSYVYFGLDKPYQISAQTMGDPSLEIGDTISVQTRYQDINDGYKDMIITKQHFTFNGGLQCSIEGVGD